MTIQIEQLHELFFADFENGILYHKSTGQQAGGMCRTGYDALGEPIFYWRIWHGGKNFYAHRVIFALYHGHWPEGQIDHIDGNRLNNKIENLRDVSTSQNLRNRQSSNPNWGTGILNVGYTAPSGKVYRYWRVDYYDQDNNRVFKRFSVAKTNFEDVKNFAIEKRTGQFSERHLTNLKNLTKEAVLH